MYIESISTDPDYVIIVEIENAMLSKAHSFIHLPLLLGFRTQIRFVTLDLSGETVSSNSWFPYSETRGLRRSCLRKGMEQRVN